MRVLKLITLGMITFLSFLDHCKGQETQNCDSLKLIAQNYRNSAPKYCGMWILRTNKDMQEVANCYLNSKRLKEAKEIIESNNSKIYGDLLPAKNWNFLLFKYLELKFGIDTISNLINAPEIRTYINSDIDPYFSHFSEVFKAHLVLGDLNLEIESDFEFKKTEDALLRGFKMKNENLHEKLKEYCLERWQNSELMRWIQNHLK